MHTMAEREGKAARLDIKGLLAGGYGLLRRMLRAGAISRSASRSAAASASSSRSRTTMPGGEPRAAAWPQGYVHSLRNASDHLSARVSPGEEEPNRAGLPSPPECARPGMRPSAYRFLVVGAAGFIGRHIVRALAREGCALAVHGREAGPLARLFPYARRHALDLASVAGPGDWRRPLEDIDAVVIAAGIMGERGADTYARIHERAACALFEACAEAGVRRVVLISAAGADDAAGSRYWRSKAAAERCLERLGAQGRIGDWVVLRPSVVVGRGGASDGLFRGSAALSPASARSRVGSVRRRRWMRSRCACWRWRPRSTRGRCSVSSVSRRNRWPRLWPRRPPRVASWPRRARSSSASPRASPSPSCGSAAGCCRSRRSPGRMA